MSRITSWFSRRGPMLLALLLAGLPASMANAQANWGVNRSVGGVMVDAEGVLRQATERDQQEFLAAFRQQAQQVNPEMKQAAGLRKVSLRALAAALSQAAADPQAGLPDSVAFLAGLQRIQYVLVYPEQNDIVLAGPGEGWTVDGAGNVVGVTNGRPVLRLEDLLIAFRSVEAARREGISVSIDPTDQGRQNFEAFMQRQTTFNRSVVAGIAKAMGPQQITYTGIPTNSHFARVLAASDYRMKCLAMDLMESPVRGLPSYLEMLKSQGRLPGSATPRWWMACNYQPLVRSDDRLVWELRGPGVKTLTEDEFVAEDGTVRGTGKQDAIAKQWADLMTAKYAELAQKEPVFAELQNLMDMCVVAALIHKEDLIGLAGGNSAALLADAKDSAAPWNAPKTVPTLCSFLKIGSNYVITASGGVQIESWEVAARSEVDPQVKAIHGKAAAAGDNTSWWWN